MAIVLLSTVSASAEIIAQVTLNENTLNLKHLTRKKATEHRISLSINRDIKKHF